MAFSNSKQLVNFEGGIVKQGNADGNAKLGMQSGSMIIGATGSWTLRAGTRPPAASQIAKHAELMVEETEAAKSQARIYMERYNELKEKYKVLEDKSSEEYRQKVKLQAQLDESAKLAQEFVEQIQYIEMLHQALQENQDSFKREVEQGGTRTNKLEHELRQKLSALDALREKHEEVCSRQERLLHVAEENRAYAAREHELQVELGRAKEDAEKLREECAELNAQLGRHMSSINHMQVCINDKLAEINQLRTELDDLRQKEEKWKEDSERHAREHQEIVDNFQLRLDAKELEIEQEYEKQKDLQSAHNKEASELTKQKENERQRADANRQAYVACKALWKASRFVLKQKRERLVTTNAAVVDLESNLQQQHQSMEQLKTTYEEKIADANCERNKMLQEICTRNEQELDKIRSKFSAELDCEKAKFEKAMEEVVQQKDKKLNELQKALQTLQEQHSREPPITPKTTAPEKVPKPQPHHSPASKIKRPSTESRPVKVGSSPTEGKSEAPLGSSRETQPHVRTKFSAFQKLQKQLARGGTTKLSKAGKKKIHAKSVGKENVFDF